MNKKYLDSKKGSLEELSTKIATEQPTIDRTFNPNVNLKVERKYFDTKPGSLADAAAKVVSEGLDPVNKDAVKKKFADRKDKDIDNDGDVDSSDKFLHKRRAAISKAVKNEELGKEDEPKIKKIIGKLKKASGAHAGQAKDLEKAMREEKDCPPGYYYCKMSGTCKPNSMKNESVMPDDKGEKINQMKHKKAKEGEKEIVKLKEVDNAYAVGMSQAMKSTGDKPPLKKSTITKAHDIAKGIMKKEGFASDAQRRAAFASGYKEKGKDKKENKTFSELRKQTGEKGKTLTGSQPSTIETEPKTERI